MAGELETRLRLDVGFRGAVLIAAVAGGVVLTGLTELLSLLGGLTFGWLVAAWAGVLGAAGLVAARLHLGRRRPHDAAAPPAPARSRLDRAMACGIAVAVAMTAALALFAVPITYDSMTYHLARVAHWAQNRSVAFYPTHVIRQLFPPPWAEYAVLHTVVLAGGDRLANLVQWGSMAGCLVGVSVIARQLGAGARGQLLAAFVCATIPIGLLQASTTQNDYAAALWLVCLTSALLALAARSGPVPLLGAGASLGLALLTKGTAYIFAGPLVVILLFGGRDRSISRAVGRGLVIGLCAVGLNAPHYARNVELFGSPLGPGGDGNFRYANDALSLPLLTSNVLRNLGLHAGTPWAAANARIELVIDAAHRAIGVPPDDPRSTWPGTRFAVTAPLAQEDLAPNGLHLLLIAAAIVGVWRLRGPGRARAFSVCLVTAFLLFCLLLRWQPWHSRLQLPLFVLGAPLVGVVFERLKPALLATMAVLLAGSSVYFLAANKAQPLVGRRAVFSTPRAEQRAAQAGPAYVGAARFVASTGCREVGLVLGSNDREYLFWALLADAGWRGRMDPVLVANVSAALTTASSTAARPCAVIRVAETPGAASMGLTVGPQYFQPAWSRGEIAVLVPAAAPAAEAPVTINEAVP